jgi:hypothetical protein
VGTNDDGQEEDERMMLTWFEVRQPLTDSWRSAKRAASRRHQKAYAMISVLNGIEDKEGGIGALS